MHTPMHRMQETWDDMRHTVGRRFLRRQPKSKARRFAMQAGETVKSRPWMSFAAIALIIGAVVFSMSRRYMGQAPQPSMS